MSFRSVLSSATRSLRKIQAMDMRQQPLELGDDGADMAEFTLQIRVRRLRVGGPGLGDEACAGADAQRCGGMRPALTQRHGLTDKARDRCDLRVTAMRFGSDAIPCIPRQRAIDLPAIVQR